MITAYTEMNDETAGFEVPQNMTPEDLGDTLARLVWESFSDFIADGAAEVLLGALQAAWWRRRDRRRRRPTVLMPIASERPRQLRPGV